MRPAILDLDVLAFDKTRLAEPRRNAAVSAAKASGEVSAAAWPLAARAQQPAILHDRVAEIMAQPDVKERFAALGFTPATGTSAEFATFLKSESDLWKKIVDDAHIQIN